MADDWVEDALPVVDRSTLEAFELYPYRARMVADGKAEESSLPMEVGCIVHDALAMATARHIEFGGNLTASEIQDAVLRHYDQCERFDYHTEALLATRSFLFPWARWLGGLKPGFIMRHDCGKGDRSGQMAMDFPECRVTSEVDLMLSTASPEYVRVIDYKTGWGTWDADDVEQSFQFTLHALLIFANYPEVQEVGVSVWNTRTCYQTPFVRFHRKHESSYFARVEKAVKQWAKWHKADIESVPCYPSDLCRNCPVLLSCRIAGEFEKQSPAEMLSRLAVLNAQTAKIEDALKAHVKTTGQDVIAGEFRYGLGKPKKTRPTMSLYQAGKESDD